MRKLLALLLILTMIRTSVGQEKSATASTDCLDIHPSVIEMVEQGICPEWIPEEHCEDFLYMIKRQIEFNEILCSPWKVESAINKKKDMEVIIKKHTMKASIYIKDLNAKQVEYKENMLTIKRKGISPSLVQKLKYASIGGAIVIGAIAIISIGVYYGQK